MRRIFETPIPNLPVCIRDKLGKSTKLHSVWDTSVIARAHSDEDEYAEMMDR